MVSGNHFTQVTRIYLSAVVSDTAVDPSQLFASVRGLCVVSGTAWVQAAVLTGKVFESNYLRQLSLSTISDQSQLSPPVWGKLLGEGLDPPSVALLAQNVVVQGVAPEWWICLFV